MRRAATGIALQAKLDLRDAVSRSRTRVGTAIAGFWAKDQSGLALLIYAAVFVNTLIFVLLASDPLLTQDGWYFLDVFVRHAYDGTLGIDDFYVQRAGLDHAQPLRKLILLMELKWFRLSFLPEAVIGLFCAGLCAYLLYRLVRRESAGTSGRRIETILMCLIMGCVFISLNSTNIWTWPLVALSYTSLVFVFWFFIAAWNALDTRRYAGLVISSLLLAAVADDTAILADAAVLVAALGFGWKKCLREGWWRVPLLFMVVIGLVQILIDVLGPVIGSGVTASDTGRLLELFLHGGWWQWPMYALSGSVASRDTLQWLDPAHVRRLQALLAIVLAGLHLWFWWRFLRTKANGTAFVAVCLMLLFYASVAGIVYGRVGVFGSEYLNQPRYVLFYQLNLVALALMAVGGRQPDSEASSRTRRRPTPAAGFALIFLILQVVFAKHAWQTAPYIRLYYWKMAEQTLAMARHPEVTPPACAPELPLCDMPPAQRAELLALLQKHNLNLYNDKFRLMHGFSPTLQ
jgi:hypothetical protein